MYSLRSSDFDTYFYNRYNSDPPTTDDIESTYPGDDSFFSDAGILNTELQGYLNSKTDEDIEKYNNITNGCITLILILYDLWGFAPNSNVIPTIILIINSIYSNSF
jgi:hypothetical protein